MPRGQWLASCATLFVAVAFPHLGQAATASSGCANAALPLPFRRVTRERLLAERERERPRTHQSFGHTQHGATLWRAPVLRIRGGWETRNRRTWGHVPISWFALKLCVLYCGGCWALACGHALAKVAAVAVVPGGLGWLIDECSSHGTQAVLAFVCFTASMLTMQLVKIWRVLHAASVQSVSRVLVLQAVFSLVFVSKCAWVRVLNRTIDQSLVHAVLVNERDMIILAEALVISVALIQDHLHQPWRGKGRRVLVTRPQPATCATTPVSSPHPGRPTEDGAESKGETRRRHPVFGLGTAKSHDVTCLRAAQGLLSVKARDRQEPALPSLDNQGRGTSTARGGIGNQNMDSAHLSACQRAAVLLFSPI